MPSKRIALVGGTLVAVGAALGTPDLPWTRLTVKSAIVPVRPIARRTCRKL